MKFLLLLSILFSLNVHAQDTWFSGKIRSVYPLADGKVVITFTTDSPACANGNSPKYYFIAPGVNAVTELGLKNMYSAALTAATAGKEVTINFDASSNDCYINRLSVAF